MSIFAYLNPRHNPLKMPDADKIPNPCGIKWQGPVLSGKRSTTLPPRLRASAVKSALQSRDDHQRDHGGDHRQLYRGAS